MGDDFKAAPQTNGMPSLLSSDWPPPMGVSFSSVRMAAVGVGAGVGAGAGAGAGSGARGA